ncbi:MAG: guanylate kinase [Bernardetiaceae bacterium]|jgi:guanylate kinase|nr:guanylate kinase [Bernardetiaceae bacterium]
MPPTKLIVFSAPSGAGKTTIVKHLLAKYPQLAFSVSATTRAQRPHELHGRDYYFISQAEFEQKIAAGEFLEYEQVYGGTYYGTLKAEIERLRGAGRHVVFDVDVEGGLHIKAFYQAEALAVFVKVSSLEVLAQRLNARNTESAEKKAERLAKATKEMAYATQFDTVVVNDDLPTALARAEQLYEQFTAA